MTARASSSLLLQCHSLQRRASWHLSQHYNTANDRERSGICFSIRRMLQQLYIHRTMTTSSSSSSASPASSPSSTYCITFLTDVEGDGAYFDRFIEHSKVLGFRPITPSFGDSSRNSSDIWNLGKYDVNYFPYDKEVVFLHHTDDNNNNNDGDDFNSNSILVYGGDTWDKGNGSDLYVMRQLLSLQVRHPHRVYLLMGNRDINKMRIVNELVGSGTTYSTNTATTTTMPKHNGAYWLLRNREPSDISPIDVTRNIVPNDNIVNRLQWMLQSTMGSKDAFELRRTELLRERITFIKYHDAQQQEHYEQQEEDENSGIIDEIIISDMEVVQSYIQSCCPNSGIMSQYLSRAKLAVRIGPVLFLHGALPLDNMLNYNDDTNYFPTPWISSNNNEVDDNNNTSQQQQSGTKTLTEWINALDDFASQQVEGWKTYGRGYDVDKERSSSHSSDDDIEEEVWCTKGGYFNSSSKAGRMFGALLQYGMGSLPNRSSTQSCIYNSWMRNGMPRDDIFGSSNEGKTKTLCNVLEKEGIQIILSGHQPVGDAPWPILVTSPDDEKKERKTWILPCDTSFSGDTHWTSIQGLQKDAAVMNCSTERSTSGRGILAFSEPLVHVCSDTNNVVSLTIHGCLSDGSYYKSNNMMITDDDDKVGQKHGQYEFQDIKSGEMQHGLFWFKGLGNKGLITCGKGYNVWNSYTAS